MHSISDLPPELWDQIITTACIDGGFTGRSLALTNRFFHEQSLSSRFHSLAFTSLARVEAFIAFADAQPKKSLPKIHHLYISFIGEANPERAAWHPPLNLWLYWPAERIQQAREAHLAPQERHTERLVVALTRLFAIAGPRLRTLCILEPTYFHLLPFPFDPMPNLRELTLEGSCNFLLPNSPSQRRSPDTADTHGPTLSARFPSLERLHCVGRNWSNPVMVLANLAAHPPASFTHLRFSGVATAAGMFPPDLAIQFGVKLEGMEMAFAYKPATGVEVRLPHLRHLIVHSMKPEPPRMGGFLSDRWAFMYEHFEAISQVVWTARRLPMLVLNRPWRRNARWEERLFSDWTDRLEGGCGCWVSSEEEEMQREMYEAEEDAVAPEDGESVAATDGSSVV